MSPVGPNITFNKPAPHTRRQLAELLLSTPAQNLPALVQTHLVPALKNYRDSAEIYDPPSDADAPFLDALTPHLQSGALPAILAASLFRQAWQLPLPLSLDTIPDPFFELHLQFLLFSPQLFTAPGDVDRYFTFLSKWTNYLHTNILQNPTSPRWIAAANFFFRGANFVPTYFTSANLRQIYSQRGDIIDFTLRQLGSSIDHPFPARIPNQKIRLGILAHHYGPVPETFAALPLYEHLDPAHFETTLYAVHTANHRLEHYCRSRAAALKPLPAELYDQIAFLRADNLDILFFASNVTAVLSNITALAAHRLARRQITSIACVTTTGLATIDAYLSSSLSDPAPDAPTHYREKLIFPDGPPTPIHCFSYGSEKNTAAYSPNRAHLNVPDNALLLASGANAYKILPELQITWAKILAAVPGAHLLLYPFGTNWSSTFPKKIFLATFSRILHAHNVDPKRLCILDPQPPAPTPNRDDIKKFLALADLYLDSFPFGGSTSIIDPFEVSLPPIVRTAPDASLRTAMSAALLKSLHLEELITESEDAYITLAANLATDEPQRTALQQKIRTAMQSTPPFLDSPAYVKKITPLLQSLITG